MEDNMAITIKGFEDILKTELAAVSTAEFASHMTTIQNMCSKVDFLIGEQGEQKKWSTNILGIWMPSSNKWLIYRTAADAVTSGC